MNKVNGRIYKLSPSDFRYLWEDCKHCYYKKVKYGVALPSIGIPGVFMRMNSLLQNTLAGMNLRDINPNLPSGVITLKEGFLKSIPVPSAKDCFISGRFDVLSELPDGTYAVIDFKITDPKEDQAKKFANQLHAYKFALENPVNGDTPKKVSKMGLITISPKEISFRKGSVVFTTTPSWFPIEEDMDSFFGLISDISSLLNAEEPLPSKTCAWCLYRGYSNFKNQESDIPF